MRTSLQNLIFGVGRANYHTESTFAETERTRRVEDLAALRLVGKASGRRQWRARNNNILKVCAVALSFATVSHEKLFINFSIWMIQDSDTGRTAACTSPRIR